jgi:hypothetical protein
MTRLAGTAPHRRTGGRLLAILLALLLALTSLSSHGATEGDHADCLVAPYASLQLDAGSDDWDRDEPRCSACSALTPAIHLSLAGPAEPAATAAVAFTDRTPLLPRRPPRA